MLSIDNDQPPQASIFNERPGCTVTGAFEDPIECFNLFFADEILEFLVDNTNEYATVKLRNRNVSLVVHE